VAKSWAPVEEQSAAREDVGWESETGSVMDPATWGMVSHHL
jgi:hypothetical protein